MNHTKTQNYYFLIQFVSYNLKFCDFLIKNRNALIKQTPIMIKEGYFPFFRSRNVNNPILRIPIIITENSKPITR